MMDNAGHVSMPARSRPQRTLGAERVVPVLASVLMVMAGLVVFDLLLVRAASQHSSETGTQLFEKGLAARQAGRNEEALELFRSAYNRDTANPKYHLAFAEALRTSGRVRESQAALDVLLTRVPASGPANAGMARLLAGTDWQKAAWYYHRALYGEWEGSPDLRGLRFELANLLAAHNAREQLISEVVLLDAGQGSPAEAKHLARLQLAAGEWYRAEKLYRSLLQVHPEDRELMVGLARAQFGAGEYLAAERGLRHALASGATEPGVQRDLDVVAGVNALDPGLRRLAPAEKHRRTHELASVMLSALRKCSPENSVVAEADRGLAEHARSRDAALSAEADLDLFERLWAERDGVCRTPPEVPESVELLARHLMSDRH